ncbi:MAG: bifunctional UDP-N-acetylmuramoyl-tripeptide:D-alanyl-D-alanine ligase/alanine racemase, partial [Bacteroidales bacterium]|nr:bifunctional UDP-N-acetylmuramoyl-tripeptide:D-alanyl-D-alanine ligase/alanine racemase [Candidatus Sodaliphilus fimicaballi]
MKYAISDIAQVLGATESILGCPEATVSTLLIDSRSLSLPSETLFFALRTSMGNGHKYVSDLYDHGVRNFVVESLADISEERRDANYLVVNNTLIALQMLAAYHRHRFESLPIIAITGSRGKTRVKEWLNQLLSPDYRIVRSPRSFNSQIGVPLSLWNIDDDTTLAIIEAGISTTGEMASLQAMIAPTMGVITNVGDEHDEGFSSIEEKIREKARLLQDCKQCIYCGEDQRIKDAIPSLTQLEWSQQDDTAGKTTITYTIDGEHHKATVPFTAPVDIENAVTCLGVLLTLGITPETIAQRMALLTHVATRINVIEGVN